MNDWIEKEHLNKRLGQICVSSAFFKEAVNMLKKYAKKFYLFDKYFDKYEIKEQKFENITAYSNHKIANMDFDVCCHPRKGDEILAFVESGNIILHHKFCERAQDMLENKKQMVFVEWAQNISKAYKIIFSLDNKRGALAAFLTTLSKMQANVLSITLSNSQESSMDFFEANVEFPNRTNVSDVKERLKSQYKILDFTSLNDAYNN